jgi:LAO/AO transport system kinase
MVSRKSELEGSRLALSRLLTHVENDTDEGRAALNELFPSTGNAHLIGVTGAPGTGKSSLVNQIALHLRRLTGNGWGSAVGDAPRVAIVAVDPSSPFTGGAILGDRIRMRDLAGDSGVFIRSMASRGSLGGLASATSRVVQILDAAGYEIIIIETMGAGQAEVDIARLAHTTLVIETPNFGDDIQAIKAGILEIADILVINKADLPGVEITERSLQSMLQLAHPKGRLFENHHGEKFEVSLQSSVQPGEQSSDVGDMEKMEWIPPIQRTIATSAEGIGELVLFIKEHYNYLRSSGEWKNRDRARLRSEFETMLRDILMDRWRASISEAQYNLVLEDVFQRELSPYQALNSLIAE